MNTIMTSRNEKTWALLTHLSGFTGYIVVFGQFIAPLIIYFVTRERSKFLAFHALQACFFQIAIAILLAISGALTGLLIGFPLLLVVGIAGIVYPIVGALKSFKGEDFEYWMVGKIARDIVYG